MRKLASLALTTLFAACTLSAADIQGVIADWNCTQDMVRHGRDKILRQNRNCSLVKNYDRAAYGVITQDKKYYRLDDNGNKRANSDDDVDDAELSGLFRDVREGKDEATRAAMLSSVCNSRCRS